MRMKKGISLIVLVITIIVMVILAGAVIITLENTDLIKHPKQATNKTNYSQEITRLEVLKNGILTDNLGKITLEEYVAELTNKGMIEGTPVDNADGSKTVKMTSGAEVKLTQDGPRNILIEIPGYTDAGNNQSSDTSDGEEPTKAIITFTINGNTYQAEDGMTWAEYRTSGLNVEQGKPITDDSPPLEYISDGITVCVPAGFTVRYNGTAVVYGDKIVANGIYVSDNPKY